MARPSRIQQPGAWYHVIARGIERREIFSRDRDREHFLELLGNMADWSRELALYLMRENGQSLRVAAAAVGIRRPATAGMALQRFARQLVKDKNLRKAVGQVKKLLA